MPVPVLRAGGRHRDRRARGRKERLGGRGPTAVMGHLEEIDHRDPAPHEFRVHAFLDVAGQQEAAALGLAEEDDRGVVDRTPVARWRAGDRAGIRPQDVETDFIHA